MNDLGMHLGMASIHSVHLKTAEALMIVTYMQGCYIRYTTYDIRYTIYDIRSGFLDVYNKKMLM